VEGNFEGGDGEVFGGDAGGKGVEEALGGENERFC
jgi:hypothetical protein